MDDDRVICQLGCVSVVAGGRRNRDLAGLFGLYSRDDGRKMRDRAGLYSIAGGRKGRDISLHTMAGGRRSSKLASL
jgi:hypothetical protein